MIAHVDKHQIPSSMISRGEVDSWTTPWVFNQVIKLAKPVPYRHQPGAVIWVTLDAECSSQLSNIMISKDATQTSALYAPNETDMNLIGMTTLTQGNLNNNHFYLRPFIDHFPSDLIGGNNKTSLAKKSAKIHANGEVITTDIDGKKMLFRARGWVKSFFKNNHAQVGDQVAVYELAPFEYMVKVMRAD